MFIYSFPYVDNNLWYIGLSNNEKWRQNIFGELNMTI